MVKALLVTSLVFWLVSCNSAVESTTSGSNSDPTAAIGFAPEDLCSEEHADYLTYSVLENLDIAKVCLENECLFLATTADPLGADPETDLLITDARCMPRP